MSQLTDVYLNTLREIARRSNQVVVLSIISIFGCLLLVYQFAENVSVPLLNITTTSGRATIALLAIYFLLGFVGANLRSFWHSNLNMLQIEDFSLASAVKCFPCIFNSSIWLRIPIILTSLSALGWTFQSGSKPLGWGAGIFCALFFVSPHIRMFIPSYKQDRKHKKDLT